MLPLPGVDGLGLSKAAIFPAVKQAIKRLHENTGHIDQTRGWHVLWF